MAINEALKKTQNSGLSGLIVLSKTQCNEMNAFIATHLKLTNASGPIHLRPRQCRCSEWISWIHNRNIQTE